MNSRVLTAMMIVISIGTLDGCLGMQPRDRCKRCEEMNQSEGIDPESQNAGTQSEEGQPPAPPVVESHR